MAEIKVYKTNEKILIWMHRTNTSGQQIASKIGVTRQAWSQKMKSNTFSVNDLIVLKSMGFSD